MPIRHFAPIRHGRPPQFELKIKYNNSFVEDDSSSDESDSETESETDSSYSTSSSDSQVHLAQHVNCCLARHTAADTDRCHSVILVGKISLRRPSKYPHHCSALTLFDQLTNPAQSVSFTAATRSVEPVSTVTEPSRYSVLYRSSWCWVLNEQNERLDVMTEIFNGGRTNVHDENRSGQPSLVTDDLVRVVDEISKRTDVSL
ncbi:hypothetical protein J6590_049936 [Homalodisca vitripennis]|nr:hypothetical protein J6590_049936 [Homalodisca vitripennis]